MGEEVCAWIQLKEADRTTVDELKEFCKGQISHYKIPTYVRFVESYPLTVTGKVRKNVMRDETNKMIKEGSEEILIMGFR